MNGNNSRISNKNISLCTKGKPWFRYSDSHHSANSSSHFTMKQDFVTEHKQPIRKRKGFPSEPHHVDAVVLFDKHMRLRMNRPQIYIYRSNMSDETLPKYLEKGREVFDFKDRVVKHHKQQMGKNL